jgi:hypothetical protein
VAVLESVRQRSRKSVHSRVCAAAHASCAAASRTLHASRRASLPRLYARAQSNCAARYQHGLSLRNNIVNKTHGHLYYLLSRLAAAAALALAGVRQAKAACDERRIWAGECAEDIAAKAIMLASSLQLGMLLMPASACGMCAAGISNLDAAGGYQAYETRAKAMWQAGAGRPVKRRGGRSGDLLQRMNFYFSEGNAQGYLPGERQLFESMAENYAASIASVKEEGGGLCLHAAHVAKEGKCDLHLQPDLHACHLVSSLLSAVCLFALYRVSCAVSFL